MSFDEIKIKLGVVAQDGTPSQDTGHDNILFLIRKV